MSSPADFSYLARLLPLKREIMLIDPDEGVIREYWDDCCLAFARKRPETVAFTLGHNRRREAGRFVQITALDAWLVGVFRLADTACGAIAADTLRVGAPVSIGFDPGLTLRTASGAKHRVHADLNEVALVERGAYPGAVITHRWVSKTAPASQRSSAVGLGRPAAGEIFHSPPGTVIVRPGIGQVLAVR